MAESSRQESAFTEEAARNIVRELRHTPEQVARLFAAQSDEVLHHRPPGGWSAVEIVGHLADHDAFERTERIEAMLRQVNPTLPDDVTRHNVVGAGFQALSAAEALASFRQERGRVVALLERLNPGDWLRTAIHPQEGKQTLLQIADLRGHDRAHLSQAAAAIADGGGDVALEGARPVEDALGAIAEGH